MGKILVEGQFFDPDEAEEIYSDGRFSSRGVNLYKTRAGNLVLERWTHWQGEHDEYRVVTVEEAVDLLRNSPHPCRAAAAIQKLGVKLGEL